jgi:hypothetical protein
LKINKKYFYYKVNEVGDYTIHSKLYKAHREDIERILDRNAFERKIDAVVEVKRVLRELEAGFRRRRELTL